MMISSPNERIARTKRRQDHQSNMKEIVAVKDIGTRRRMILIF